MSGHDPNINSQNGGPNPIPATTSQEEEFEAINDNNDVPLSVEDTKRQLEALFAQEYVKPENHPTASRAAAAAAKRTRTALLNKAEQNRRELQAQQDFIRANKRDIPTRLIIEDATSQLNAAQKSRSAEIEAKRTRALEKQAQKEAEAAEQARQAAELAQKEAELARKEQEAELARKEQEAELARKAEAAEQARQAAELARKEAEEAAAKALEEQTKQAAEAAEQARQAEELAQKEAEQARQAQVAKEADLARQAQVVKEAEELAQKEAEQENFYSLATGPNQEAALAASEENQKRIQEELARKEAEEAEEENAYDLGDAQDQKAAAKAAETQPEKDAYVYDVADPDPAEDEATTDANPTYDLASKEPKQTVYDTIKPDEPIYHEASPQPVYDTIVQPPDSTYEKPVRYNPEYQSPTSPSDTWDPSIYAVGKNPEYQSPTSSSDTIVQPPDSTYEKPVRYNPEYQSPTSPSDTWDPNLYSVAKNPDPDPNIYEMIPDKSQSEPDDEKNTDVVPNEPSSRSKPSPKLDASKKNSNNNWRDLPYYNPLRHARYIKDQFNQGGDGTFGKVKGVLRAAGYIALNSPFAVPAIVVVGGAALIAEGVKRVAPYVAKGALAVDRAMNPINDWKDINDNENIKPVGKFFAKAGVVAGALTVMPAYQVGIKLPFNIIKNTVSNLKKIEGAFNTLGEIENKNDPGSNAHAMQEMMMLLIKIILVLVAMIAAIFQSLFSMVKAVVYDPFQDPKPEPKPESDPENEDEPELENSLGEEINLTDKQVAIAALDDNESYVVEITQQNQEGAAPITSKMKLSGKELKKYEDNNPGREITKIQPIITKPKPAAAAQPAPEPLVVAKPAAAQTDPAAQIDRLDRTLFSSSPRSNTNGVNLHSVVNYATSSKSTPSPNSPVGGPGKPVEPQYEYDTVIATKMRRKSSVDVDKNPMYDNVTTTLSRPHGQ